MQKDKVFESNPGLEKYFKTSDGQAFYIDNDAKNHAKTLKNKSVETIIRADVEKAEADTKKKAEAKAATEVKQPAKSESANTDEATLKKTAAPKNQSKPVKK